MWNDLPDFIRVIRRLMCDVNDVQMGSDPTVLKASNDARTETMGKVKNSYPTLKQGKDYPMFKVSLRGSNGTAQYYYTLGPPIWTSVSLFGRGTTIWKVYHEESDQMLVLKKAWRTNGRRSESDIYESIRRKGGHKSLAKFVTGCDVRFPSENDVISPAALRKDTSDENNLHVHRLLLSTIGGPL